MNLLEIKRAVDEGLAVFWASPAYEVVCGDDRDKYFICCVNTGHCISLTHSDGVTLNGKESEFYVAQY